MVFPHCNMVLLTRTAKLGEPGSHAPLHFLPQMQFLIAFLDHRVTKSCKVTRTKFQFSKFPGANPLGPLDGSCYQLLTMGPHSKLRFAV